MIAPAPWHVYRTGARWTVQARSIPEALRRACLQTDALSGRQFVDAGTQRELAEPPSLDGYEPLVLRAWAQGIEAVYPRPENEGRTLDLSSKEIFSTPLDCPRIVGYSEPMDAATETAPTYIPSLTMTPAQFKQLPWCKAGVRMAWERRQAGLMDVQLFHLQLHAPGVGDDDACEPGDWDYFTPYYEVRDRHFAGNSRRVISIEGDRAVVRVTLPDGREFTRYTCRVLGTHTSDWNTFLVLERLDAEGNPA
jgi:hypothetical protein